MIKAFFKYLLSLSVLLLGIANLYANHQENGQHSLLCYLEGIQQQTQLYQEVGIDYLKSTPPDQEKHKKEYEERVIEEELEEYLSSSKKTADSSPQEFASLWYSFLLDYFTTTPTSNCPSTAGQFTHLTNHTPLFIKFCVYRI